MARNGRKKDEIDVARSSKLLKAIADTDRLRLVLRLRDGEQTVGALASAMKLQIVNVSHHLGVLRNGGVVKGRKSGRNVWYGLNPDVIRKDGAALQFQLAGCRLTIG